MHLLLADPGATVGPRSLLSDTLIVYLLTTAAISYGIPAVTDFIVKSAAPRWFKNLVVAVLSAVAAAIPAVTFVHGERWTDYLFAILAVAFPVAQIAHRTGYSDPIQHAFPGGVGPTGTAPVTANDPTDPLATDSDEGDTGGPLPPAAADPYLHPGGTL